MLLAQSRENIASVVIDVLEECEELLIEVGRKYRSALSIDGNDVRALYNLGLALSLHAQLIADIGLEAAFDADKEAIAKFDAMVSRSNAYAPDEEKMKLLQQARSSFEDVLSVESNMLKEERERESGTSP
ncbi:uncharacterized protein LOC120272445 isoform X2 [Dioscorea cayenensis subsp. rotundata]|uniref:Uncharacterized protein LOC120272445 isoform X2 n=1 Tax=Dioscorea cayennensis subsp. rotundata TaxID=55577 RepID=A0AB40C791_DIOCR|nr:uncharacterized protein LOC120272445 isoform X2 [Dioscorea cayenensis subsp. rotundata]